MGAGTVVVCDDDAPSRELLACVLDRGGFRAVQVAAGEEVVEAVRASSPVLVVLDVVLPGVSGYEVVDELRREFGSALPIALLSGERVDWLDRSAGLRLGADEYFLKPVEPEEFLVRVRMLVRRVVAAHDNPYDLTPRELQILRLLAAGRPAAAIATQLFLSPKTVHNHIDHVLAKLRVHSRSEAVALAHREGLV